MREPQEETSLGVPSCLFRRLWSPICLEARSPDTTQLLSLISVPSLMNAVPVQPPVSAHWQGTWPGVITQAKCSPRSSPVCCCPHWCLDTSPWRLVASPSDVIHACQQLWIVGCSSHLWHLILRPRSVLKRASTQKESLASLKSYLFQMFLKTWGEKCLWDDSKWRDTRKAFRMLNFYQLAFLYLPPTMSTWMTLENDFLGLNPNFCSPWFCSFRLITSPLDVSIFFSENKSSILNILG